MIHFHRIYLRHHQFRRRPLNRASIHNAHFIVEIKIQMSHMIFLITNQVIVSQDRPQVDLVEGIISHKEII